MLDENGNQAHVAEHMERITREEVARAFGVPPHLLGLGVEGDDPVVRAAAEVERICDHVHRAPRGGTLPREMRVWRPFGTGDMCLMVETSQVLIEPARGHGQVSGPITVRRFDVEIECHDIAGEPIWAEIVPTRIEPAPRPVLMAHMHVTAHSPWESRQVTVSHRDALLGLALGVVRHGVPMIDADDPAGRALPRPVAVRWARQIAEVARFMPAEEGDADVYAYAEHVAREHRTMQHDAEERWRELFGMSGMAYDPQMDAIYYAVGAIGEAERRRERARGMTESERAEVAGRTARQAERARLRAQTPKAIRAGIERALAETDRASAELPGRDAQPNVMSWRPPPKGTERPGADLSWLDASLAENGSDQDG